MCNFFYKWWIWYLLSVVIAWIYVQLAFSFFHLLTLLVHVGFSSTAPCKSAIFLQPGHQKEDERDSERRNFFSLFFYFSFFNITIHKDWHLFHSIPETPTVTKTKKKKPQNKTTSFNFTRGRAYRRVGVGGVLGWVSKHQQPSERSGEAPGGLQQGAYIRITHILLT